MEQSPVNIFMLPSWYPSKALPLFATFVKEQAYAVAGNRPDYRIIISLRSDIDARLSYKEPFKMVGHFIRGSFAKVTHNTVSSNLVELGSPAFSLRNLPQINTAMRRLYALSERNLQHAIKQYGKISLMHVHVGYPAGFVAALLSKKYGIPYIITEHMSPFPFDSLVANGKLKRELRIAFENARGSIAVSNSLANSVEKFGLARPYVISNMVDGSKFKIGTNKNTGFVFLTVGGLNKQKGIGDLLDAIYQWLPKDNIRFKIAGTGPLEDSLKKKSEKLGIEKYIEWMGPVDRDKVPDLFNTCNAFVLPSHHETFGIVYAEALAAGKPVIATRCGGPEDIVTTSNGLLIEKENPRQLAEAMEWMYNNWNKYNSAYIRQDFEDRFSQKVVSDKIAVLYEKIINPNLLCVASPES